MPVSVVFLYCFLFYQQLRFWYLFQTFTIFCLSAVPVKDFGFTVASTTGACVRADNRCHWLRHLLLPVQRCLRPRASCSPCLCFVASRIASLEFFPSVVSKSVLFQRLSCLCRSLSPTSPIEAACLPFRSSRSSASGVLVSPPSGTTVGSAICGFLL